MNPYEVLGVSENASDEEILEYLEKNGLNEIE